MQNIVAVAGASTVAGSGVGAIALAIVIVRAAIRVGIVVASVRCWNERPGQLDIVRLDARLTVAIMVGVLVGSG